MRYPGDRRNQIAHARGLGAWPLCSKLEDRIKEEDRERARVGRGWLARGPRIQTTSETPRKEWDLSFTASLRIGLHKPDFGASMWFLDGAQFVESVYPPFPTGCHGQVRAQGSALTCPWGQVEPAEDEEEAGKGHGLESLETTEKTPNSAA